MSGYIGTQPVPQVTQTREVFTATSGQTSFATSGYTPGFLDVYLNGVKLVNNTDFTATNGSDVVLNSGAATDDTVEVLSYSTFEVNSQNFTGDTTIENLEVTGAITASSGIYLGGTSSANLLEDCEKGFWTPTLTVAAGTVGVQSTYDTLNYTKVDRLVTLTGRFRIGTVAGASGTIAINLPFTSAADVEESGFSALTLLTHGVGLPSGAITTFAEVNPDSTEAYFYAQKDNAAWVNLDASGLTNGDIIYVNGTYTTA